MGAGDTIAGKVRVVREDAEGNVSRVIGPFPTDRVDYTNNDISSAEKLYVNVGNSARVGAPANAETKGAPDARWYAGEVIRVQHQSSNLQEAVDRNFDGTNIEILEQDKNRGSISPETLTVDDQELSSNPTSSTSDWVTFFESTVPDRTEWRIAGSFEAIAAENA